MVVALLWSRAVLVNEADCEVELVGLVEAEMRSRFRWVGSGVGYDRCLELESQKLLD
jgi:hypothetical protein